MKIWLRIMLFCLKRMHWPYLDIKLDRTKTWVEAVTATSSKEYAEAVCKIETEVDHVS